MASAVKRKGGGESPPPKLVRHDSSHAQERNRQGNLPIVIKLGGLYECIWTKKYSDSTVGLYSSANKNDPIKASWGSVKSIEYKVRKNKKGEEGEYMLAKNEQDELVAFKISELNVQIWEVNDWTQGTESSIMF